MAQWWETPAASLNPPEPVPPQTPNTPSFGAQDNPYLRSALSTYQQMRDQSRANLTPATSAPPPVAPVEPPKPEEGWASKIGGTILTPIAETLTQMGPALYNVADAASGGYLDEGRRRLQAGVQNLLGDDVKWQQIAPMAEGAARVKAPLEHYESEGLKAGRQQLSQAQGVGESLKTVATNPYLLAGMVAESLPWMAGIAGPAKAAATAAFEGALAKGATQAVAEAAAKTAATRASIAGNFAISGGTSGLSAQERIYGMSEAELANSPAYQQLRQQGLDHRAAQESLARSANVKTTAVAGALGAGATAVLGGGLEAQIAQRLAGVAGPSQGVIKNVLGGAAREGAEEYLQSGGERLGENIGMQAVDPTLTPMTRVFEDAAVGALVGAVAGGTFGAFGDTDRSRQGRAGQDATQRADLARVALSDLDEPRLAAAAEQARKVLVDNPRMPARQRQALESALGHLDADLQGRANGEGLRQVLADPAQLQTLRGQATLAGMADDARVSQINDEELMTAAEQAVAMAQTPALGQGLQQQFIEVAQAYAGHLKTRQQLANLDAALQADPTVAPSLAARIAQAATGQPKKGITPEYSRASLDDTELTRHLTAADRLLSQHSGRLDEAQRTRLTDARTALQAEREQRAANPDWQARNAQIIQANDPREVRLRQSFAKNPEKTVARLTANDAPLIDTLIQSFASRAENYTQTGFPAPEEITRPLTLLQARKAALATEATQQQQATEKKRQTGYLQQQQAPVPTLADALDLTPTNADPLGDWLSQRANIADEQGQMLKRTLAALQGSPSKPTDPAQQQRAQESRRLQAARLTGELIQQGVVEQADRAQTQADIDAWIGSGGRPRASGVIGQMGQPLGNPQAEPAPQGSQELSRLLGPDTSPEPATPAAPSQPQSLDDFLQRPSTANAVPAAPGRAEGPIAAPAAPAPRPKPTQDEVKAMQGKRGALSQSEQRVAQIRGELAAYRQGQIDGPTLMQRLATRVAQGELHQDTMMSLLGQAAPTLINYDAIGAALRKAQATVTKKSTPASARLAGSPQQGIVETNHQGQQGQARGEQSGSVGSTLPPDTLYTDLFRMMSAGAKARRRLGDLPPALERDVRRFAQTGQPATPKAVRAWLETQGTIGAVSDLVSKILKHQKDAQAALAEGPALRELTRREQARSEQKKQGKPAEQVQKSATPKEPWQRTRSEILEISGSTFGKWWLPLEDHDRLVDVPSGKSMVPESVKRDATKAMQAIKNGDLAALVDLQNQYASETLRDQGSGAGPGKVKQARHGVVVLFNAMIEGVSRIKNHRTAIERALAEGQPVPAEVLADYPDLQPASEKSTPASVPAPQPSPENANEKGQTETETETLLNTEPADTPLLSSYTPAELKARQVADEKAAQQKAAKEKAADEKAAADRERNSFTLSGSDRPADVAMSQGQTNLLDAMDGKAPAKAAPATPPADYGANNTLVSRERAEELRKKLRAKFGQLNAGVDPEIVAMGTELAVFHLEAGARKFAQFVQDLANDLGLTVAQMRPYLRGWYNGARDMMEDSGQDVSAMDTPDQVKAALATLTAPVEVDMFGAPEPGHRIAKLETVEIPLDQLKLSDDVPQFKSGANAKSGVVEPLGGTFDRTGVAPIQVWKRLNGDLEVISGRHRLDLARRSGEKTLPAQIHNEADGFDAKKAGIIDAELNIRDGQGKVKDYVDYFINSKISEAEANLRGLISRFIGKTAFRIANDGSAELIASHRANALSDEAANSIALAAPGNSRLQAVAIKAVLEGKSIIQAVNTLQAVKALASEQGDSTGDMFGLDDSAMREAEQMATIASRRQRQLSERLAAVQGAAKRPELARKEGVDVKDKAALDAKITEIKREREAWDRWSTNPDLIASIRDELKPGQKTPVTATQKPAEKQAAPSTAVIDIAAKDEARKQAILGHLTKLGWKPDGSQLSWNIGGAPKGGELNPFGNRLATVEIRSGFVSLLRNNGMDDPVYMVKHSISEGVSPQTIAQQFHAKVMAITAPENRAENKPNTSTGQNNETSTRQSVESRGENRPAGNGMGKDDVQPDGAGVGRGNEPGGTTDAGLGSSEQGDAGVPDNDPAVSGTKGAGRVHQPDGEPGPAERVPERGDSGRGGDPGRARVQSEPRRNETTAVDAGTPNAQLALDAPTEPAREVVPVPRPDFAAKKEAQRQAASLAVIPGDLDNIRATLPFLLPEQQEDVLKAEQRFEKHNGMLFTNGTGSGKTFTGLGVIARMVRQGKSNGIIVVPSQSKVEDWIRDGVNLGLKVSALPDTRTAGEGLVITTYANYAANDALNKRNWDFIVYDEAHKLASSQTGDSTVYQNRHEQTALLPDGILNRAQSLLSDKEKITQKRHNEILKEHNSLRHGRDLTEEEKAEKKRINLKLIQLEDDLEALPKPKILFLSATPFAYHDNLDYAAGLLFDWGPKPESRGYNTPNARQAFMMLHFGYRMRNGKLTKPEADVNVDLMERRFFEGLRRSGAVSGRKLVIEQDYSREFIEINNTLGHGLDRGINILMGYSDEGRNAKGDRRFPNLGAELSRQLDFLGKTRLLEGIKAKSAAERAQQHIAMGRKVVVFHDYIEGNPRHPFLFAERAIRADDDAVLRSEKTVWNQQVLEFNQEFPELVQLPINNLAPVIPTFMKAFGAQVRLFNGRISTQARAQALRDFNADGSDVQVLVVQRDAGKEGISLHDVSGQHQRVLMDLGLPTAPTEAIQTEGRIYRYGQASNAIIEYLKTNTSFEQHLFGSRVAARARTAENLAMGDEARNLERAFIEAYLNSHHDAPQANQGQGGKANDARVNSGDPYDNAISFYFANRKKTARDKSREGTDYYATPEPIGFKMVEWADLKPNESALEPSAGHGAIARFFPEDTQNSFIEPSRELMTLLEVNARGKVMNDTFENLHINNKYDAIVMNPPFGSGGATAVAHLEKAAGHLREGGRIVVLLPDGPAADKKLEKFLFGEKKPIKPLVTHPTLGPLYFGDTVTIEAFGTKNTFVLNSVVDGRFLREKDTPASGAINMIAATAVDPTGQRAIQSIADSLYPVADIGLPAVTFQRAGTSVKTHILVLEKHNDPQSAPPRMARMDMAGETIKELFEGLRSLSVLPRSAVTRTKDTRADAAKGMTAKAETPAPTLSSGTIPTTLRTTTHAKKSREAGKPVPWFVVTLDQKLGSDAYSQVAALAKKNKGFWSSYRGDGAIPGFQFSTEAAAKAFQSAVREQERYTTATRTDEGSNREVQEPRGKNTRRGVAPSNGDLFASGKIPGQLEFLSASPVVAKKTEESVRQRFGTVVESVKSGSLDTGITRVQTPEDAAHVLVSLAEEAQEHMMALVTDRKGNILSVIRHSVGTMNNTTVERAVLQGAIHAIQGAEDVWLAHNHPSGNISQSAADIATTNALWKNLDRTGVEVRGMIVITAEQTASFYNPNSGTQASYPISITEAQRGSQVPVTTRKIRQMTDQPVANGPIAMIEAMKRHSGGMDGILLLDNSLHPVDFVPMTVDQMHKMRGGKSAGAARLYRAMHESNANSFAATMRMDRDSQPVAAAIDNLSRFANANTLTFVDAILGEDRRSWRSAANLPSVKGDQFFAQANTTTAQQDADYLDAVNRGDLETAQRMVDAAAKAAGYRFERGERSYDGDYLKDGNGESGRGVYAYPTGQSALRKYYTANGETRVWIKPTSEVVDLTKPAERAGILDSASSQGITATAKNYYKQPFAVMAYMMQQHPNASGYIVPHTGPGIPNGKQVIFNSDRILHASADPVTYDDAGTIIPLSQRFNRESADIRYAQPASTPSTLLTNLKALSGDSLVQGLIDNGRLHLVARQNQLPPLAKIPPGQRVAGWVHPDTGAVYLIAENIAPGEIDGFLRHEVGVHQAQLGLNQPKSRALRLAHALARLVGARQVLGEPTFNDALAQLQRMRAVGNTRVLAAYAKAEKAMGALNQNNALLHEEALAYLVQDHPTLPLVQRIIAAVRAFLYKAGLKINLTENDLQALAVSATKNAAARRDALLQPVTAGAMGRNSEDVEAQRQYDAVVARYTNPDGSKKAGWLKAPNGQPTKLNERQWVQTRTENFQRWFDGSKVVDENGEPLVVYHGTDADFTSFDLKQAGKNDKGWYGKGLYFTPHNHWTFAEDSATRNGGNPHIMPVFLRIKDPAYGLARAEQGSNLVGSAADRGRDGVIIRYDGGHEQEYQVAELIVTDPTQIKSAIGNTGAFSPDNPDLRFAYTLGQAEADLTAEEVLRRVEAGGEVTADEFSLLQAYLSGASRALTATGLDAPTFKTWFGASKIKGKTGQPLKMYHGTMTDFNVFNAAKAGASTTHPTATLGFFFTNDRAHAAEKYGDQVMEVYLAIEKPYVMTDADLRQIDNREDALTFRQKLEARGYDGLVSPAETKTRYVAAFRPDQIKRTTNQTYTRGENDIRFALANPRPLTPEQQAAMDKIGRREPQGWGVRFAGLRERMGLKLRQAIADHHAALLDLDRQAYGAGVVENQTAAASWVKARLSRSVDGPMHLLLHESGLRMDADGALDVLSSVKGLQKVLAPLGVEVDDFMKWVAGNRAERLMQEGRENLFTQEDIAALKTLNKGVMADGRNRATVYAIALKDFAALQKSVMDIAEQSGLIDGNERSVWEHDFYVPFYRLAEDTQDVRSINAGDGLVRQEAFKRLKGGKDRLNDLLENTVMNWQHLLSASLKNNAARQALTNAQRVRYDGQSVAEPLNPSKESTKGAVYYRQNGQPQWFRVNDPLVLEAITALDFNGLKGPVMNVLRKARHLLTRTTTISPAFKVANLLRDTVQTLAVSQASAKTGGLGNIVQGWKHYAADSAIRQQMLAGGGAFLFGSTLEDHAEAMKKLLAKGVRPATILDTPAKLWDVLSLAYWKYEAFGDRLENVNRAALYEQLRKQGKSHLYASFQARDLLDFSQSGASGAVRFLTAVVPFLNARIQGLDKLGRAASQPAQRRRFALTLAALTLASAALYLLYKDDDDFKEREEWDRDTYWWFKIGDTAFRIPKPFEVGALATLLGDRVMEQLVDDEATPQLYLSRLQHTLTQTFSVSIPQLFAPAVDVWRNRGSFTQRPIETLAQQRLSPQLRQNANTSDVARGVSTAAMGFLSPLQADYLIAGYFGWVGRQAVLLADHATRPVTDRPSPDRFPVIHDLTQRFVPTEQGGNSKYLTRFYEAAKTAEQHYADIQELIKRGETDAAQVLVQRHREDLTRLKLYRKASAQLNDWNNQLKMLADLPASQISTDQRQSARDALQADKLRLARALMEGQPAS